jgi:membrane protease YdiL (CAAX protease family)
MRSLFRQLHEDLPPVPLAGRLDAAGAVIAVGAAALYLVYHHHGKPGSMSEWMDPGALGGTAVYMGWYLATLVLFLAVPVALLRAMGEPLSEYGLGLGRVRLGAAWAGGLAALMIPAAVVAARFPAFASHYPLAKGALASWAGFVRYELAYALYFVGWEAFWRGFLLFGLYRRIGVASVWVAALPFAMAHLNKPEAEGFGSIAACIALGYLALRTRSFWWGALLHAAVAVSMDLAASLGRLPPLGPPG